jgi:predicted GNAT family N-acyltransferase
MQVSRLESFHKRDAFFCGEPSLDNYLKIQASNDQKRALGSTWVLTEDDSDEIIGFYTLSACSIPLTELPEEYRKKIRYQSVPFTLLGRIARCRKHKGNGLGGFLLVNALKRAFQSNFEVGSMGVMVDALNEKAIDFYKSYDFIQLSSCPQKLFITMNVIKNIP